LRFRSEWYLKVRNPFLCLVPAFHSAQSVHTPCTTVPFGTRDFFQLDDRQLVRQ